MNWHSVQFVNQRIENPFKQGYVLVVRNGGGAQRVPTVKVTIQADDHLTISDWIRKNQFFDNLF